MCKKKYQVGVIPITRKGQVVLVTARNKGYWIFPKGRREKGRSDRSVARDEAFEEAGLEGKLERKYYEFNSLSSRAAKLRLFPMFVEELHEKYPESHERERRIVSFVKAESMVHKDLRVFLKECRKLA